MTSVADCERFLFTEARLLDQGRFAEWLALLSPEIEYRVPVRRTLMRADGAGFSERAFLMDEDHGSLALRVERLASDYAWSENPPTRTRRIVANVLIDRLHSASEIDVVSNLVVYCVRGDDPVPKVISGERQDRLVMRPQGWLIRRRVVLLDSTLLGMESLSILL